jgi:hypothetical protein
LLGEAIGSGHASQIGRDRCRPFDNPEQRRRTSRCAMIPRNVAVER